MSVNEAGRAPVMADVARRAGVSYQTVSRVINDHPSVAPGTRARVSAAIAELGYRPNAAARALVTRSNRTIGLVTVNISQYGPAHTMLGLEEAVRGAGYGLGVTILDDLSPEAMTEAVDRFVAQSVDAVVVQATYDAAVHAIAGLRVPVPLVAVQAAHGDVPTASVDQLEGAGLATRHLLGLGHRTVHHVRGPHDSQEARARVEAWRLTLKATSAPVPEVEAGDWTAASGHEAGLRLVARRAAGEPVTAVFVANDQMALGVLRALTEAGLRVPDDVSVVGFDDIPEAAFLSPPLTTVRQDFAALGRQCVDLVLRLLDGGTASSEAVHPVLVVRASAAAPSA
ncbi:LacI family DNA-binding transcriptional regulator [Angustibacter speluncae]